MSSQQTKNIICCYKKYKVYVPIVKEIEQMKKEAVDAFKSIGIETPPANDINFYVVIGKSIVYLNSKGFSFSENQRIHLACKSSWLTRLQRRFSRKAVAAPGGTVGEAEIP